MFHDAVRHCAINDDACSMIVMPILSRVDDNNDVGSGSIIVTQSILMMNSMSMTMKIERDNDAMMMYIHININMTTEGISQSYISNAIGK